MLKRLIEKNLWNIRGGYRPSSFWEDWGKTFIEDEWQHKIYPQHSLMLKIIKKENPKNILEIGCGFGRNIKWLIENDVDPKTITGVDISSSMIKWAKIFLKNKVKLQKADIKSLPFKNESFELVIIFSVLMHVSKNEIDEAIKEVIRVAKKKIIIVEQNYKPKKNEKASWYTFVHNYKKILSKSNLKIIKYMKDKKRGYDFMYVIKKH